MVRGTPALASECVVITLGAAPGCARHQRLRLSPGHMPVACLCRLASRLCTIMHMPNPRPCGRCGEIRHIRARGLCGSCYNRIAKHNEDSPPKVNRSAEEWLTSMPRPKGACWPWPGTRHSHGYGVARVDGVRTQAHRFVYEQLVAPIPSTMTIDHLCRNKSCVNPDHLELVTRAENLRRAVAERTPQKRRLPRCAHGDQDVYVDPSGKRVCRICRRERTRLWRAERKRTLGVY